MKKLTLVASLCIAVFVVAPIASASAAKVSGTCTVEGTTEFVPALGPLLAEVEYKFKGKAECKVGVEEKEVLSGTAEVSGKGQLMCAVAEGGKGKTLVGETGAPGKGVLKLSKSGKEPWEKELKFELTFKAVVGVVALEIKPEGEPGEAKGAATFFASKKQLAAKCATGVSELEFLAVAKGEV